MKIKTIKMGLEAYVPHPDGVQYVNRKPYFEVEGELEEADDVSVVRRFLLDQLRVGIAELIHCAEQAMSSESKGRERARVETQMQHPQFNQPYQQPVNQPSPNPVNGIGWQGNPQLAGPPAYGQVPNGNWQSGVQLFTPTPASALPVQPPQHQPLPVPDTPYSEASVFEEPFYGPPSPLPRTR